MARLERFTFLCNVKERQAIAELATHLQRSQSDTVRFIVIEAAKQLLQVDSIATSLLSAKDLNSGPGRQDANP